MSRLALTNTLRTLALVTIASATSTPTLRGQCLQWSDAFGPSGVSATLNSIVLDSVVFDDGTGPALYACGTFDAVGDVASHGLAKWNGQRWIAFGGGFSSPAGGSVNALAVYDDGSGPALYAGGQFFTIGGVTATNIAKWNGTTWQTIGGFGHFINDLLVFDDGSGPQLYVAGNGYTGSSGAIYNEWFGRWDGTAWTQPGGLTPGVNFLALAVHDDGSGPALYVGGEDVGVSTTSHLVRWDGTSWSDVGGGVNGIVYALADHDDGTGSALYVGGAFTKANGVLGFWRIARWQNGAWSQLGAGMSSAVRALAPYDDGVARSLYAGGDFVTAGGLTANGIARWDGATWSTLGNPAGVSTLPPFDFISVRSLVVNDDGSGHGSSLFVGGRFGLASSTHADNIARWNAGGWSAVGAHQGLDSFARAFGSFDSGVGSELYVAGEFHYAGDLAVPRVAKWNGSTWSPANVAPFIGDIYAFHTFDDGSGPALFAGGSFNNIGGVAARGVARWNGTQWSALGSGAPGGSVNAMTTHDDGTGPALWVALTNISRWDGTSWFTPSIGPNGAIEALASFDEGSGPALYVGGSFLKVGTTNVFGMARWNGASWSPVGNGFNAPVRALAVFDDGSGPKLYAGGSFTQAPPALAARVARWDGTSWEPVGSGFDSLVVSFASFDDGWGSALYAAGDFSASGATPIARLAKWNGSNWSQVAGGFNSYAGGLHAHDDGSGTGQRLFVGGGFVTAGAVGANHIAELRRACPCPPSVYCTAGTSSNGCVPSIGAIGTPSASAASSFVVTASGVEGQKLGLLFYGLSGATASPWGSTSSFLCVKPPQQRTTQMNTGGNAGACDGVLTLDWNAYLAAHPSALGAPFQAGALVRMQGWYRDPPSSKTTALTDALEFLLCP